MVGGAPAKDAFSTKLKERDRRRHTCSAFRVCIGAERGCRVTLKFFAKDEDATGRRAAAQAAETLENCPVLMHLCVIPEMGEFRSNRDISPRSRG